MERTQIRPAVTGLSFIATDADGTPLEDGAPVPSGADVVLVLTAVGHDGGVDDGAVPCTAGVVHDGEVVVADAPLDPTFELLLDDVNAADHGGEWTATLSAGGTVVATRSLLLDVIDDDVIDDDLIDDDVLDDDLIDDDVLDDDVIDGGEPVVGPVAARRGRERRGGVDDVVQWSAVAGTVAFLLIAAVTAVPVWTRDDADTPPVWYLTVGLFLVGLLLALVGAFLVLLDVRDRTGRDQRGLRGPIAVLALAAVVLVGVAWIGYGSTRPDSPANPVPAVDSDAATGTPATTP